MNRERNQYANINNVNLSLPTVNAESMRRGANKLQEELFDKLEISNFAEPFTLKVAEDALKGSKRGLGGVWRKLGELVRDPRYADVVANPIALYAGAMSVIRWGGHGRYKRINRWKCSSPC